MNFVKVTCAKCSVVFQITEDLYRLRVGDQEEFYCPNGHEQYYPEDEDEDEDDAGHCQNCGAPFSRDAENCEYCGGAKL